MQSKCYYSWIRYVPDPVTEDRVTIGVIFFLEETTRFVFVKDWTRAKVFGCTDVDWIKNITENNFGEMDVETAGQWEPGPYSTVQISRPSVTLLTLDAFLQSMTLKSVFHVGFEEGKTFRRTNR